MKKIGIILFASFLIIAVCQAKVKRIGLINPTQRNIERLLFLTENNFIVADSLEIVGIFHINQSKSIESANKFINDNKVDNVIILTIQHQISLDSLFLTNSCSKEFKEIFQTTDGLIFFGGPDIPPSLYGDNTFLTTNIIPSGRNWEISFLFHLIGGYQNSEYVPFLEQKRDYLILGVCLGMQEMNVASGGSLYQDIPFQIYKKRTYESNINLNIDKQHRNYQRLINNLYEESSYLHFHHIRIKSKSILDFGLIQNPLVTSIHHQSVKKLGKDIQVIATSQDKKVVEAISHTRYLNVYGIQFHPELSILYKQKEFKNAKDNTVSFNDNDKQFHKLFWKDFSLRLCK